MFIACTAAPTAAPTPSAPRLTSALTADSGAATAPVANTGPATLKGTKIVCLFWSGADIEQLYRQEMMDFEAETGIKVEYSTVPFEDLMNREMTLVGAQSGAVDVFGTHYAQIGRFGDAMLPLNDFAANNNIAADQYVKGSLDAFTVDGKLLALPFSFDMRALFYRAVLTMCGVLVYPLLFSTWVSLFDWRMAAATHVFIGLANYGEALTSSFFEFVLLQSIGFTLACLSVDLVLGLALALLLNVRFKGRSIIRTLCFLPMVTAPMLAGFNFRWIFNDRFGLVNQLLIQFGHSVSLGWLADANLARLTIVLVTVWQGVPFMVLLLLAGLQSLPTSPFEAATVGGATAWQRFRYIGDQSWCGCDQSSHRTTRRLCTGTLPIPR